MNVNFNRSQQGCFSLSVPQTRNFNADKVAVDQNISQSMCKLSAEELLKAQEDLYGIERPGPEDDPKMQAEVPHLENLLEAELNATKQGSAYEVAETMNPAYVKNRELRMMFLRASQYQYKVAAEKMIGLFNVKWSLFGTDKLTKDITMDDLDEDDMDFILKGAIQVLPNRDCGNRKLVLFLPGLYFKTLKNQLRGIYYTLMSAVDSDVQTQKKGVVALAYSIGRMRAKQTVPESIDFSLLCNSLPVHWAAAHICTDSLTFYSLMTGVLTVFSATVKARIIIHRGSHTECLYKLAFYGIQQGKLPFSPTNEDRVLLENHLNWCNDRKMIEAERNASQMQVDNRENNVVTTPVPPPETGIVPREVDYLCGKGPGRDEHEGNIRFVGLIDSHKDAYDAATGHTKKKYVSQTVLQNLRDAGARFLEFDSQTNQWKVVPDNEARRKIAKAFRNRRRTEGRTTKPE